MDTDILKPDTGYLTVIERPVHLSKGSSAASGSGSASRDLSPHAEKYTEPVSEDEDDSDMLRAPARDEDKRTGLTETQVAEAVAYRENMLRERRQTEVADGKKPNPGCYGSVPNNTDENAVEDTDETADERTPFLVKTKDRSLSQTRSALNALPA